METRWPFVDASFSGNLQKASHQKVTPSFSLGVWRLRVASLKGVLRVRASRGWRNERVDTCLSLTGEKKKRVHRGKIGEKAKHVTNLSECLAPFFTYENTSGKSDGPNEVESALCSGAPAS